MTPTPARTAALFTAISTIRTKIEVEDVDAQAFKIEELVGELIDSHGPEAVYDLVSDLAQRAAESFGSGPDGIARLDAHEQSCLALVDKVQRGE